jgi:hypothetical protein
MSRRNGAGDSLARAQAVLAETDANLAALVKKRNAALIDGSTDADVALIDDEIAATQKLLRTHTDRVSLLFAERDRVEGERRIKERQAHVCRVEAKLAERDEAAGALQKCVEQADKHFLRLIELAREVRAAWPWRGDQLAPALIADGEILRHLRYELYRAGARPLPGGGLPGPVAGPSFPGGTPEDLSWAMLPDRIVPLAVKFAAASEYAVGIMRGDRARAAAPPPAGSVADDDPAPSADHRASPGDEKSWGRYPVFTADGPDLAPAELADDQKAILRKLLLEQQRLAELDGPEADEAYRRVGEEIAQLANQGA